MPSDSPAPRVPEARRRSDSAPILALSLLVGAMALVALARHRQARAPAPPPAKIVRVVETPGARALREGEPLDVNTASETDLQLLPRIGPALSARIAAARPFGSVDDLLRVRGIGARTLERLRPLIRAGEEPSSGR